MTTESRSNCLSENGTAISQRWCIYIDILGFSHFWGDKGDWEAFYPLRELMSALFRIGTKVYPNEGDRLFVHQMGDGFAIVSDFGEYSLERPISIAIALMRQVVATGKFAAATIAEGDFADIQGCYPREVTDYSCNGLVRLGRGLMTLSTVMGTAFIRAYGLHNKAPSGPFLTVSDYCRNRVPNSLTVRTSEGSRSAKLLSVDWVRAEMPLLSEIQAQAGLEAPTSDELVQKIRVYCMQYPHIREKWKIALNDFLAIKVDTNPDA